MGDPRALTAEAGLLAVDEVEASVLLFQGWRDGALVSIGHDPDVERPEVTWKEQDQVL